MSPFVALLDENARLVRERGRGNGIPDAEFEQRWKALEEEHGEFNWGAVGRLGRPAPARA